MSRKVKSYPPLSKFQSHLVLCHRELPRTLSLKTLERIRGYSGSLTYKDLESVGFFALCVAATRYDPLNSANASFKTYAWKTIDGYLRHALRDKSRIVKLPRWIPQTRDKIKELLEAKHTYEEISEILDISMEKINMCERSWKEIHCPIDENNEDKIYFNMDQDNELFCYLKSLNIKDIKKLTKKATKGNFSDPRIQKIISLGG